MTTISYRRPSHGRPSFILFSGTLSRLSAYVLSLADRWSEHQAARQIEAMPFDMRKDFGWPAADISSDRK
ncbi:MULTISPECIES: hypothetical protein [Rhizobium]|uniref:DUF1127 domain-containing protein n=1 Tax=Rhizobium rhododendri TaxID=2506430 RepID=A0ABY8ILI2_9HYPH|nr:MULTISPECIES: hypothetical protein [Rhizobium]MBO9098780.1 hypothetical protein [Rhizobium sp. L58/93]MBO9132415.1 hypothetical protein [Rhizobium sp. B209b/85]MBO9169046.1 hypothetical protein [Rhizobium sp. L245/93]MBO9184996.1 hypothetical protein [Rhizobium sp. E27B/91]MBZ5758414.1 hypothetical protein [Rhizobium sp. VS19-DR96]